MSSYVAMVIDRVDKIRTLADDDEAAHAEEDGLHEDVLRLIADQKVSGDEAVELAKLALSTLDISFCRWCA